MLAAAYPMLRGGVRSAALGANVLDRQELAPEGRIPC